MPDPAPPKPERKTIPPVLTDVRAATRTSGGDAKVVCERCGAEMYRMHAVWRCASCGYKTDCCGW
jgi:hypothetical protein